MLAAGGNADAGGVTVGLDVTAGPNAVGAGFGAAGDKAATFGVIDVGCDPDPGAGGMNGDAGLGTDASGPAGMAPLVAVDGTAAPGAGFESEAAGAGRTGAGKTTDGLRPCGATGTVARTSVPPALRLL